MRCSAPRRPAAETISMARVIFWMFLIEPIRLLTSLSAMGSPRRRPPRVLLGGLLFVFLPALGVGLAAVRGAAGALADRVLVGERLALLVEVVTVVLRELGDRLVEPLL